MGACYKCGAQFTLKDEEIKCDNCNEIVNYPCNECKKWFSIIDEENNKIRECLVCGFFVCPNCGACGSACKKKEWSLVIEEIISKDWSSKEKARKIVDYIEQVKLSKEQKLCPKKVPLSYAKNRIKSCLVRMQGYNVKGQADKSKFEERLNKIFDLDCGTTFTVSEKREAGSYGQEYRDVINAAICYGKVKAEWKERKDRTKYLLYTRIENLPCPLLDEKNLLFKKCPKCKKEFPLDKESCPSCIFKRGAKQGEPYKLILKISNKDTCQLNRGAFHGRGNR